MQLSCAFALCSELIAVLWVAGGGSQHVADKKEVLQRKLLLAPRNNVQRDLERRDEDLTRRGDNVDEVGLDTSTVDNDEDDEGDANNGHEFQVVGTKGESNTAHDNYWEYERTNIHTSIEDAVIQNQEVECLEYLRQQEMAIKHGRKPEDVPTPNVSCQMIIQTAEKKGRHKRIAIRNPGIWDKGIVPFLFVNETLSDKNEQLARIRAHTHYEYWTCMRFVPYNDTTQSDYGLGHNNYLRHEAQGGCRSFFGNLRKKNGGQFINCCGGDTCVHELGHAFGLQHEQKKPLSENYVEKHYENIQKGYQSQYYVSNIKASRSFGYYDMSSVMHYGPYGFSTGGQVMSIFDPTLEYLLRRSDPLQYYLFGEVSQITDCNGLKCSSFSLTCKNAGYQAFIKNQCTCRCPEGLDPATGCRTRYDGDRMIAMTWPSDSFTLLSTRITGCPSGFYEGSITQHHLETRMTKHSTTFSAGIDSQCNSTRYKFCTKKKTEENGISPSWPEGKYCIYRHGGRCPTGFSKGYIQYDDTDIPSGFYGLLPDGQFSTNAKFYFCCRSDGNTKTPITLPSDEPFVLFADTSSCQEVSGMNASKQYLRIKNNKELLHTSGDIPRLTISYKVNYKLYFCYYTPSSFNENLSYSKWPKDPFALIQAATGCPEGFESGQLVEYSQYSFVSPDTDTALSSDGKSVRYKFCTKTETTPIGDQSMWRPGSYCILRVGGVCPNGFSEGSIALVDSQRPNNLTGSLSDGSFVDHLTLNFCCRSDGFTRNPIQFPNKEPFILFKESDGCQKVEDMSFEESYFTVGTYAKSPKYSGDTPKIWTNNYRKAHFYICYYYPAQYDCGDTIHLSKDGNTTANISSPGYPNLYPGGKTCYWNIIAPEGFKLKLEFNEFDIVTDSNGACDDRLEIRHSLPGQFGLSNCGDSYPMTVLSEENQIGLTFETSLRKSGKGFSARATLLDPSDTNFCYTKNGENYRGNVDVTRQFARCLPWSEVKHCSSNTYNPTDLDDDLLSNYCRNPGHGTRPWCITNKFMCTRNYCDVCGIENCYDIFDDCEERVANGSNCNHDPELQRGCRMSCNLCDKLPKNKVGSVTCDKPNVPSDSTSGILKENYSVDETVDFVCKTNAFEKQTITCLADGSWSNAGFVCGRCKTGWTPYQGQCYKFFNEEVDRSTAVTRCLSENNATLASSKDRKENNFVRSLVQDGFHSWIGLENGFWPDGDKVQWTNYDHGSSRPCAFSTTKAGKWQGVNCGSAYYIAYVCSYSPQARQICEDATPKCEIYLNVDPLACENEEFAWHTCPKTCGYCDNIQDNCPVPSVTPDSNTELVTCDAALSTGKVLEYRCKAGFSLTDGKLHRACLRNGSFTGSLPVCKASSTVPEPNNAAPLLRLGFGNPLVRKVSYTAQNDMMSIQKSGRIVKWQFYSSKNGIASLQVWRATSINKTYTLIGQNEISETYVGRIRTYEVPLDNQIEVQSGDLIGVFPLSAAIPYEKCSAGDVGATYGSVMESVGRKHTTSDWTVLSDYSFKDSRLHCRIIPVTAFIR